MGIAFRLHRLPDWQHWNRKKLPHRKNATRRIIDARLLLVKNDWHGPVPFSLRGAKPGPVGIDESSSFSEETLRQNAENLKERGVVYTAQSIDKAAKVAANLPNRRVLLIMIGKT